MLGGCQQQDMDRRMVFLLSAVLLWCFYSPGGEATCPVSQTVSTWPPTRADMERCLSAVPFPSVMGSFALLCLISGIFQGGEQSSNYAKKVHQQGQQCPSLTLLWFVSCKGGVAAQTSPSPSAPSPAPGPTPARLSSQNDWKGLVQPGTNLPVTNMQLIIPPNNAEVELQVGLPVLGAHGACVHANVVVSALAVMFQALLWYCLTCICRTSHAGTAWRCLGS
jgi:hypothetical protein